MKPSHHGWIFQKLINHFNKEKYYFNKINSIATTFNV